MTITLGRRVRYLLTAEQATTINRWRRSIFSGPDWHIGTPMVEGDVVSLDITRVSLDGTVNGRAILDGNDVLWVTGISEGTEPGTWSWPPRV